MVTTSPTPSTTLAVTVVTPEGTAFDGAARSVVVPGHDGEVAFLPGHAPFVGALGAGELRISLGEQVLRFHLEGGVVQVLRGAVTVLAESVLPASSVDGARARADLERALAEPATGEEGARSRDRRLASARARLRAAARR